MACATIHVDRIAHSSDVCNTHTTFCTSLSPYLMRITSTDLSCNPSSVKRHNVLQGSLIYAPRYSTVSIRHFHQIVAVI